MTDKKRASFFTYYTTDPKVIERHAQVFEERVMKRHGVDTIVVRGGSGLTVGAAIRMLLPDLNMLIIKKPGEKSHSGTGPVGTIGERWVFFDDFICTGATFAAVYDAVAKVTTEAVGMFSESRYNRDTMEMEYFNHWTPEFMGVWAYKDDSWTSARAVSYDKMPSRWQV